MKVINFINILGFKLVIATFLLSIHIFDDGKSDRLMSMHYPQYLFQVYCSTIPLNVELRLVLYILVVNITR